MASSITVHRNSGHAVYGNVPCQREVDLLVELVENREVLYRLCEGL